MEKKTAAPDNATSTCHIARTPNEILLEILQLSNTFTAVKDEDFAYEGSTQINRNAVRASHVSSRWRSVALATPILWGRFDVSASVDYMPDHLEELIDLHLERSKDSPLDIRFLVDSDDDSGSFPILPRLFAHAHRWRTAVLALPQSETLKNSVYPKEFPVLQKLDIRSVEDDEVIHCTYWSPCPSFRAPLLRELTVEKFCYEDDYYSGRLDEITLISVTPNTVASFLKDVSTKCHAKIFALFTLNGVGSSRIISPLKALSITITSENDDEEDYALYELLNLLMLPNVEKLEFTGYGREEFTFPVDQFLSMIGHPEVSMTKLTHLKLEGYAMSDDNFLRVLEKLSALTSLTFKEADGDGDEPLTARFFRSLVDRDCLGLTKTRDGRSDALVPQLTHIKLRMRSKSLPWNELHSFLESRQDSKRIHPYSIVSLLKATIYIPKFGLDQISDDSKSRFVKLRSGGLDVRIITSQK